MIYAVAFLSFWLYSSNNVWMFFCCLLSYGVQFLCIPFMFAGLFENKKVEVTLDNITIYAQKEANYKIVFALLTVTIMLLDAFPFVAMSGAGNIPEYEGGLMVTIMTLGIWCVWVFCIVGVIEHDLQKEYNRKMVSAEKAKVKAEQQRLENERIDAEFNSRWQELSDKYGECTIDVCIGANKKDVKHHIYVFEDSATIMLLGEEIAFDKILGFILQDDSKTIMTSDVTSYTSTTKTSTGSMLGRAAVGGVLLGGVGALVGANTAKKETVITPNQSQSTATTSIKHNYICYVNVNDLANPMREIALGENSKKAQTVVNIFNIIISRCKNDTL